jgi:hypothetical protein
MIHAKLNIIPLLLSGFIALTSCSTAKGPFGQVDDDVYFSRKQSHTKDVYVPEVDVQEIIKDNPPQYGTDAPTQRYNDYNNGGNSNFNYDEYKAQQGQTQQDNWQDNNTFLNTVPYVGQEEEAAEASRLRMQYSGNYNTYNTYNYYNDPGYAYNGYGYNNYYNNWYTPTVNVGFSSWGGWGVGLGWGWSSGWGYGWPHYNPYWGGYYGYYNPWAWNSWYSPWPYYGNCWGGNNCYGPYGGYGYYPGYWGYNKYSDRAASHTVRPRQSAGSSLPRGENIQPRGAGMTGQAPSTPNTGRAMPRNPQQGQLINRDGQQIYVAPEQNRTQPRTYNSYDRSVRNGQIQRDVTPAPQQPVTPRSYGAPPAQPNGNYRGGNPNNGQYQQPQQPQRLQPVVPQQRNSNPAPAPSQPQRNYSPAPSAPSSPRTISPPSGGSGGRGSSGSSGSGGGGRTMPRR